MPIKTEDRPAITGLNANIGNAAELAAMGIPAVSLKAPLQFGTNGHMAGSQGRFEAERRREEEVIKRRIERGDLVYVSQGSSGILYFKGKEALKIDRSDERRSDRLAELVNQIDHPEKYATPIKIKNPNHPDQTLTIDPKKNPKEYEFVHHAMQVGYQFSISDNGNLVALPPHQKK